MARLGEAYVRVRADLKDYDADLDKALQRSTDKFEKAFNANLGKRVGKDVAAGFSTEFDAQLREATRKFVEDFESEGTEAGRRGGGGARKGFNESMRGFPGSVFFEAVGGAITDGLSGLPPQIKAILGATVVSAIVPLGAVIASGLAAGVALGVVGLGATLASQFEVIDERAVTFGRKLRETLVESARPFIAPILEAFARLDSFIDSITDRFANTFTNAARFVEPLTLGVIALLDSASAGLDDFIANSDGLIDALTEGMVIFGEAINVTLDELGSLGEDGETALRDMLFAISDLLVFSARFLALLARMEGALRDVATGTDGLSIALKILLPPLALAGKFFGEVDAATFRAQRRLKEYDETTGEWVFTSESATKATKAETKALQDQAKAIDAAREAQFRSIDSTLSYMDALDNVTETLKENKGAFDFTTKAGREGVESVGRALREAEDRARDLFNEQKLTAEQAQELYRQEREEIYRNAEAQGVNKARIDEVFGAISNILNLPPAPNLFANIAGGALSAAEAARELRREINRGGFTPPSVGIGDPASVPGYAEGGIVDTQQLALIGEGNRREVVLPLSNPRRTRELAAQSGLMNVLGGDGASTVIVYVGNEQLDSRMYRVARSSSQAQARMMTQGPRTP